MLLSHGTSWVRAWSYTSWVRDSLGYRLANAGYTKIEPYYSVGYATVTLSHIKLSRKSHARQFHKMELDVAISPFLWQLQGSSWQLLQVCTCGVYWKMAVCTPYQPHRSSIALVPHYYRYWPGRSWNITFRWTAKRVIFFQGIIFSRSVQHWGKILSRGKI